MIGKILTLILLFSMMTYSGTAACQDLPVIRMTMLLEHEGFLMWYAKKHGFDVQTGVNIDLTIVDTNGIDIINRGKRNPHLWDATCVTSIPMILGSQDMSLEIVGIANDESTSTGIYVLPDSEIMSIQGWNEDFPEVYGSPETVKGKTFGIKNSSSGVYILSKYLEIFDLDLTDVNIKNLERPECIKALQDGAVDAIAIWSPDTYFAEQKHFANVTTADLVEAEIPIMFLVAKKFSDKHPETVGKMLAAYMLAVEQQIKYPKTMIEEYKEFLEHYRQKKFTTQFCELDIMKHSVLPLETQLKLFESEDGRKSTIQELETTLASQMMVIVYDSKQSDLDKIAKEVKIPRYVSDKYLKIARRVMSDLKNKRTVIRIKDD